MQIDPLEPLDVEASSPPEDSIEEASTPTAAETSTPSMTPDRPQADRRKERIKAHHDRKKSITKATDFDMKSPTSGDPMPALQGLNISKLSSLDSLSEYVNPDPIDFVLCMGNFSMRDEDMYKNLMNVRLQSLHTHTTELCAVAGARRLRIRRTLAIGRQENVHHQSWPRTVFGSVLPVLSRRRGGTTGELCEYLSRKRGSARIHATK